MYVSSLALGLMFIVVVLLLAMTNILLQVGG